MLAAAVETEEWLFMKEDSVAVSIEGLFEDLHGDQILEDGLAGLLINGTKLKLVVGHFVVLGLEGDSDLQQLSFHFLKDLLDLAWNFAVIMVRKLLIFGCDPSEQTSARRAQVLTMQICSLWYHKELLLQAECQEDLLVWDFEGLQKCRGSLFHDRL